MDDETRAVSAAVRPTVQLLTAPSGFTLTAGGVLAVAIGRHGYPGILPVWLFFAGRVRTHPDIRPGRPAGSSARRRRPRGHKTWSKPGSGHRSSVSGPPSALSKNALASRPWNALATQGGWRSRFDFSQ